MPSAPLKPCAHPACPALVHRSERYCAEHFTEHYREQDARRESSTKRGYGRRWAKVRAIVLNRDPLCCQCKRAPSTEADHITPKRHGGTDALANLQGLCKPCHSRKTARETG